MTPINDETRYPTYIEFEEFPTITTHFYWCKACSAQRVSESGKYCRTCTENNLHIRYEDSPPVSKYLGIAALVFAVVLLIWSFVSK